MGGSGVSGEASARRDNRTVLAVDRSADDQPRPSGRNKPGDIAGESLSGSAPSVPGLADWLLTAVTVCRPR